MLPAEILAMLRCPEDRTELAIADDQLVERLNAAIESRRLNNRAGQSLERTLDGALVRADGKVAYPIIDQIPILLIEEGIRLGDL